MLNEIMYQGQKIQLLDESEITIMYEELYYGDGELMMEDYNVNEGELNYNFLDDFIDDNFYKIKYHPYDNLYISKDDYFLDNDDIKEITEIVKNHENSKSSKLSV